jgi:hypothetical protein
MKLVQLKNFIKIFLVSQKTLRKLLKKAHTEKKLQKLAPSLRKIDTSPLRNLPKNEIKLISSVISNSVFEFAISTVVTANLSWKLTLKTFKVYLYLIPFPY